MLNNMPVILAGGGGLKIKRVFRYLKTDTTSSSITYTFPSPVDVSKCVVLIYRHDLGWNQYGVNIYTLTSTQIQIDADNKNAKFSVIVKELDGDVTVQKGVAAANHSYGTEGYINVTFNPISFDNTIIEIATSSTNSMGRTYVTDFTENSFRVYSGNESSTSYHRVFWNLISINS